MSNENPMRGGKTDGRLFPVTEADVVRGAVLRMVHRSDGSVAPFSDFVVVDAWDVDSHGLRLHEAEAVFKKGRHVRLARPYAFVSGAETCAPTVLTGVEYLEVPLERLLSEDSLLSAVVQSTGLVATHLT